MTREGAINYLYSSGLSAEQVDAIVDALEPEPETDGDCISRAKAIECLNCGFDITGKKNMETVVNYINSAHDKIMNLPNVQPEQKTGRWIYTGDYITDGMLKCSECGFEHDVSESLAYCPNCGCRMSEVGE